MAVDETQTSGSAGVLAPALLAGDPRQIGEIRLLGRLGEGGMGTVYLGQLDGRPVAVKVIRAGFARDEVFQARFRAEAEAAQRVARFCTATVLDAGVDGEMAYLVTEFIDGPTLTAAVHREGPLHGSMLDSLAIGVAAALNGIHAAGVVHRDLKPSNVLLSRLGPKVIDFGIARAPGGLDLTDSGRLVGTPAYMAPEQFSGVATAASDIFSWGSVIGYAASGGPPFGTGTPFELMQRITHDDPDLGTLDEPLRTLTIRALDKRPERRPTARALLLALVGDRDDPVEASSRILSSTWEAPMPTLVDGPPTAVLPQAKRADWRTPAVVAGVLAVLVAAAIAVNKRPGGGTSGSPSSTPSTQQSSTSPHAQAPHAQAPDGRAITIGRRTPATGFETLAVNEVHHYRLNLASAQKISIDGQVEGCAHLVPWTLSTLNGATIADENLNCNADGPYTLAAGQYDLSVGGAGVDGKYAFRLVSG